MLNTTPEAAKKRPPISLNIPQFTLLFSLFLAIFYNDPLWKITFKEFPINTIANAASFSAFFVFIVLAFSFFLSLAFFKHTLKPISIAIVCSAAGASYFMSNYGIVFDKTMIQNLLETDTAEVKELLNLNMLWYFGLYALIPSIIIILLPIKYFSPIKELKLKIITLLACVILMVAIAAAFYKDLSSLFRNNREIRNTVIPSSYIYYGSRYLSGAYTTLNLPLQHIAEDAQQLPSNTTKRKVTVVVVGETARAMNFSLNGYARETNPELKKLDILNFSDTFSCGTSTAWSLPCMFSLYDQDSYSTEKANSQQNVLDVLKRTGIDVLWRDNNSGCKGVCDRVDNQQLVEFKDKKWCNNRECFDEVMLNNLDAYLDKTQGDVTIVLHQKGNHGPAYYLRYPDEFKKFTPVCTTNQLQKCDPQSITNAYDNAILYTDYFLAQVIKFLQQREQKYRSAMIYMSDHGESLGENNIYLHGLPYFIAPDAQKKVPFVLWLSPEFSETENINTQCLRDKQATTMSHDNLFHSLLGMMSVTTGVYDKSLDVLSSCKTADK